MSDYYKEHAQEFIDSTFNCDMSVQYHFFEKHLKGKGTILDIGFGSGRDSLHFKSKGYEVYAIDPEKKFVEHAKELGLANVFQKMVEDLSFTNMFDGIWACASLLHLKSIELNYALKKCSKALKKSGVMYASFKYGTFEGKRSDRYYLDLTENSIKDYLKDTKLSLIEFSITEDVRPDRTEKWLNVILKK